MTSFCKVVSELYRRYPGHPTLQVMSPIRRCVRLLEIYYILFAYKYVTQYDLNEGKSVLLIKTGRLETYALMFMHAFLY